MAIRCTSRLFTAVAATLAALIGTWTASPVAAATALPDKTLVFCSEGSPAGFDPGQYATGIDFTANTFTLYNRLVEFERGATQIEPGLAQSWEVSPDGLQYTFHLRHGVKFHTTSYFKPTRDFNADDVLFTFERMLDANQPFQRAYPVQFPYMVDLGLNRSIAKVDKLDPYTVRFTLRQVNAPFLQNMAMAFASVLSAEYADQLLKAGRSADINLQPIGTGPFIFRGYSKDATLRFDGNPQYWKPGAVKLSRLIFSITVDPAVRMEKLKRNECQVAVYPRPADLAALQADPKLNVLAQAGFNLGYLSYNVSHKPLDQVDVRRALDMAIDKNALIASIYQGAGQLATHPMPPTQWSYDPDLQGAPYDPVLAKKLLAKAGFPNGFEISLWAMPVQRPYNPNARLMAEMIQSDWAKIGVRANIVTYEWGEYIKRARAGDDDTMLIGWSGDNGDPDNWLGTLLGCAAVDGNNSSKWCDKPFDALIVKGRDTADQAERVKLYKAAQRIFAAQLPFSPIAHSTDYLPASKDVTGLKIEPLGYLRFDGVGLK